MINNFISLLLVFGLGIGLGLFYFGALWWTVRRLPGAQQPVQLMISSFIGRMAIILPGFYFAAGGRLDRLGVCLLGFLIARNILLRHWRLDVSAPKGVEVDTDGIKS